MNAIYNLGPTPRPSPSAGVRNAWGGGELDNKQFNDFVHDGPLTELFSAAQYLVFAARAQGRRRFRGCPGCLEPVEDELDALFGRGLRLVAVPAATRLAGAVVRESVDERVLLAVGPEGGWNDFEVQLLETHGFQPVGMGSRTLRTDTACIALLALVHDAIRSRT